MLKAVNPSIRSLLGDHLSYSIVSRSVAIVVFIMKNSSDLSVVAEPDFLLPPIGTCNSLAEFGSGNSCYGLPDPS